MKRHLLFIIATFFLNACVTGAGVQQSQVRRITPEALAELIPQAVATYTLAEIVADAKKGITPDEMVEKIKLSESLYDLNVSDVLRLNQQGVDVEVLDYIQKSNILAKQNYLAEEINKREREKEKLLKALNNERLLQLNRFYAPSWSPYWHPFYRRW